MSTKSPGIVGDPKDITAEYLSAVLNHSGVTGQVADFQASNVGTGQVGQNVRFALTWADGPDPKAPASVVGKFTSDDPVSRETGKALLNYLKEVRFYQQLRSTLDIQTPKVLFTDIEEDTHNFVLMMEDLAPAAQGDQLAGCDVAAAKLGLTELARLHGPRWGDASLYDYDWLGRPDPAAEDAINGLYEQLFPGYIDRYGARLSDAFQTMIDPKRQHAKNRHSRGLPSRQPDVWWPLPGRGR